jgi:AcrR family transcriptional regulator
MDVMTSVTSAVVADPDRKGPGRPRSARADEAIIEAVLDLFAEGHTFDALSIEAIAARAGVGKATIYRRWPNKEALVVDAVIALKGPVPPIAGESVRDDLVTLLKGARKVSNQRAGKVTICLLPELHRNETMHGHYQKFVEPRRAVMRQVLLRGIETGELRADIDVELTLLMLSGPMITQSMLRWNPNIDEDGMAERLVDQLLNGISAV